MKGLATFAFIMLLSGDLRPAVTGPLVARLGPGATLIQKNADYECSRWRAEIERIEKEEKPANQEALDKTNDQLNANKRSLTEAIKALTAAEAAGMGVTFANKNRDYWKAKVDETTREATRLKGREKYFNVEISRLESRIKEACPNSASEPSPDAWQKAIGKWGNKDKTFQFELQDLNKADREYYRDTPIKIEGYILKPGLYRNRLEEGDILFISRKVSGNTISGKWLNAPQGTDCPKLSTTWADCTIRINTAGDTLTVEQEAIQYAYPSCKWSTQTRRQTFTYNRFK